MKRELGDVLAEYRGEAAVLEHNKAGMSPDRVLQLLRDVQESAEEWLTWLSENDASIRCGKSARWIAGQFPALERDGNARMAGRSRQYRAAVIPRRANTIVAAARGRDAARALRKVG